MSTDTDGSRGPPQPPLDPGRFSAARSPRRSLRGLDPDAASGRAAQTAALATRQRKVRIGDGRSLHNRFTREAIAAGFAPQAVLEAVLPSHAQQHRRPRAQPTERSPRLLDAMTGSDGMTKQASSFSRRDAIIALAAHSAIGSASADNAAGRIQILVNRLLLDDRVVPVLAARTSGVLATRAGLDPDQQSMVRTLATSGVGVDVVVGKAGTGRSTALGACRAALDATGIPVVGVAPSATAAHQLAVSAGITDTATVDRLLAELHHNRRRLPHGVVVVLDETAMCPTRTRLLQRAVDGVDGKIVDIGDHRQIPSVDVGGGHYALAQRLGASVLGHNHRSQRVMLATKRATVAELNRLAHLVARGDIARRARTYRAPDDHRTITLAVGDEAILRRNHRLTQPDGTTIAVRNGMTGRVAATRRREITVELDGTHRSFEGPAHVTLPAAFVGAHVDDGYARTVDTAQGATVDHSLFAPSASATAEQVYVALSRGRFSNRIYATDDRAWIDAIGQRRGHALAVHQKPKTRRVLQQVVRVGSPGRPRRQPPPEIGL